MIITKIHSAYTQFLLQVRAYILYSEGMDIKLVIKPLFLGSLDEGRPSNLKQNKKILFFWVLCVYVHTIMCVGMGGTASM